MTDLTLKNNAALTVSVIIPHYRDQARLRLCLDSLRAQTLSVDAFEIIVADNDTPGGIADIVKAYPDVQFINVTERGAAPARNAAMDIARGDVFAFIDSDCVASQEWLAEGLKGLETADYVGGAINVSIATDDEPTPVEAFELVFGFRQHLYLKRKQFSATANLFVHRATAKSIGPFTNAVAEDLDWGQRAAALGFRLAFNVNSIVSHPARRDWSELILKWDRLIQERWSGFRRHHPLGRLKWVLLATVTAFSLAPHIWQVATSKKLERLQDRAAAVGVLARIRLWRARKMLAMLGGH